jgi:DNA-directed RNA polymerase subunit alpha
MEPILLPSKIQFTPDKKEKNKAILTVEPCFPGYGTTLGNALRRMMLSSLSGAAVTAVKIKDVTHEFSTIPGIKEDVLEIILNLKKLRLKVFSNQLVILNLKAKGEKKVKAEDIEKNPEVEIINLDLEIANLTDKKASLEMRIWVERGRGYLPVEERKQKNQELGVIAIDSIFTPIKNIGLRIENVRVGQRTDYDKLILDIETDGTLSPQEAVSQAAELLIKQFSLFIKPKEKVSEVSKLSEESKKKVEKTKEKPARAKDIKKEEEPKKKRGRLRKVTS